MEFTEEQIERYSRQIILPEIGGKGQERLSRARILVVGAGGLGSPAALYLAAAGVGTVGIADADDVDLSNLQRQILHATPDVGRRKVDSAEETLSRLNPGVTVKTYGERLTAANAADVIGEYDFVIDGTDNFPAKFLLNDACVFARKGFSHAGILRFEGQTLTVVPGEACYRCVFPHPPPRGLVPSCSEAGILGVVAGIVGAVQAAEAIKAVLGVGSLLTGRLLVFDALKMSFRTVPVKKNPRCPVCGDAPSVTALRDEEQPVCDLSREKDHG